jgi:hypothetical protein
MKFVINLRQIGGFLWELWNFYTGTSCILVQLFIIGCFHLFGYLTDVQSQIEQIVQMIDSDPMKPLVYIDQNL